MPNNDNLATYAAYSAYDSPNIVDLKRYFHASAGYPVQSTWLKSIGDGNYSSFPGITLSNATKYYPYADATIMIHIVQKRQGLRLTKPNPPPTSSHEELIP